MNYYIPHALASLRPGAEWTVVGKNLNDIIWHDDHQDRPTDSEIEAEVSRLTAAGPLRLLRVERDRLLAETDWWALPDSPTMSDEQTAYRQALRDLPATTADAANPSWPSKP